MHSVSSTSIEGLLPIDATSKSVEQDLSSYVETT